MEMAAILGTSRIQLLSAQAGCTYLETAIVSHNEFISPYSENLALHVENKRAHTHTAPHKKIFFLKSHWRTDFFF